MTQDADAPTPEQAALLAVCQGRRCFEYHIELREGEHPTSPLRDLLVEVNSFVLRQEDGKGPFHAKWTTSEGRTALPSDFTDEDVALLKGLYPHVDDPELRARLADTFILQGEKRYAPDAIRAYLCAGEAQFATWPVDAAERVLRALALAREMNQKQLGQEAIGKIEALLADSTNPRYQHAFVRLVNGLQRHRGLSFQACADHFNRMAWHEASVRDYYSAHDLWCQAAVSYEKAGNFKQHKECLISAAEAYVCQATLKAEQQNFMAASSLIQRAIETYRRADSKAARTMDLESLLRDYQVEALDEMQVVSTPMNLPDNEAQLEAALGGKSLQDACLTLAAMSDFSTVHALDELRKGTNAAAPFQALIPADLVDEEGKVIGKIPSQADTDPEKAHQGMTATCYRLALMGYGIRVAGEWLPAIELVASEHELDADFLLWLTVANPWVPDGCAYQYARAISAGFYGDWITVVYQLPPLLEASVRMMVRQRTDSKSWYLDQDGLQQEKPLNVLLREPKLVPVLGEDLLFHLRCLLVERAGANLRNRAAHGFLGDHFFLDAQSLTAVVALWCLTLKLLCVPMLPSWLAQRRQG